MTLRRTDLAAAAVALALGAGLGLGCQGVVGPSVDAAPALPPAVPPKQDLKNQMGEGFGIVDAPEARRFLNRVLAKLAGDAAPPMEAHVRADFALDVHSTRAGNLFVPIGLLQNVDDEAEIAFWLAREVGHVALQHHDAALERAWSERRSELVRLRALDTRAEVARSKGEAPVALSGEALAAKLLLAELVPSPPWSPAQEAAADRFAVDALVRAGYDAGVAVRVLEGRGAREAEAERGLAEGQSPARFAESPPIDAIFASMRGTLDPGGAASALRGYVTWVADALSRSRAEQLAERRTLAERYVADQYGETARAASRSGAWTAGLAETRALLSAYGQAHTARTELLAGDLAAAEKSARASIRGKTGSHALPRFVFYLVRRAQGRLDLARENLELASRGRDASPRIALAAADLALSRGNPQEAAELLERANYQLGRPRALLPGLVALYRALGRERDAAEVERTCRIEFPDTSICEDSADPR